MDIRQLQQLDQFVAFFDLITNPDKFKQMVIEAQEASESFNKFVKEERGIKDVDQYRAKVLEQQAKRDAEIESKAQELNKRIAEFNEFMDEVRAKHTEKEVALQADRRELVTRLEEVAKAEQMQKEMEAEREALEAEKATIAELKASVKKREEQLAAVLKGE